MVATSHAGPGNHTQDYRMTGSRDGRKVAGQTVKGAVREHSKCHRLLRVNGQAKAVRSHYFNLWQESSKPGKQQAVVRPTS